MKMFFYSLKQGMCGEECRYHRCPSRCLASLRRLPVLRDMVALPAGLHSLLSLHTGLRSGDLLLLYAASWYDLEELLVVGDLFESFRVILILGDEGDYNGYRYHCLRPRFVTPLKKEMVELEAVVSKMMDREPVQDSAGH